MTHDLTSRILEQEKQEREALLLLLDRRINQAGVIPVHHGRMGHNESYLGMVTLQWFAENVRFAHQLPLFKSKVSSDTATITIDEQTIEEIVQRPLNYTRRLSLAAYLAGRRYHKFPPVTVVLTQPWADDLTSEEWAPDRRAKKSTVNFTPLDRRGTIGLLDLSEGNFLYALDGQHRLLGAQGLMELIKTGRITVHDKLGRPQKRYLELEEFAEQYGVDPNEIQSRADEKIGIEIIAAVNKGETRDEARRRIRSVFVHTNRMAAPLTQGQLAQLDEDNGFAIVARRVAINHPLLKKKPGRNDRVNWNSSTIAQKSTVLTTLQTLKEMTHWFLKPDPSFQHWYTKSDLVPLRPDDEELERGTQKMWGLLDYMSTLPCYKALDDGVTTGEFRRFRSETPPGQGHMLFRPIGQVALAQAVGVLTVERGRSLEEIFSKLRRYDKSGGFTLDSIHSPWWGVLYDPLKQRITVSGRDFAARILVYLLDGATSDKDLEELRLALAEARTLEDGTYSLNGDIVDPNNFQLPNEL